MKITSRSVICSLKGGLVRHHYRSRKRHLSTTAHGSRTYKQEPIPFLYPIKSISTSGWHGGVHCLQRSMYNIYAHTFYFSLSLSLAYIALFFDSLFYIICFTPSRTLRVCVSFHNTHTFTLVFS